MVTVTHASVTGAAANPNALVDGPKWDAAHAVTGMVAADSGFTQTGSGAVRTTLDGVLRDKVFIPEMFGLIAADPIGTVAALVTDNTSPLQACLDAIAASGSGGTMLLGPGIYKGNIRIKSNSTFIEGAGANSTVILHDTGTGIELSAITGIISNVGLRNLSVQSADITHTKIAINPIDVSRFVCENVIVSHYPTDGTLYRGGAGSIGLQTNGRELLYSSGCEFYAERPLVIDQNPNALGFSIDSSDFDKTVCYAGSSSHHAVEIVSGGAFTSLSFKRQNWIGGVDAFHFIDTTGSNSSIGLHLSDIKVEQSATPLTGWAVNLRCNSNLASVKISNLMGGDRNGISLGVGVRNATLSDIYFDPNPDSGTIGLNVDSGVLTLELDNCTWQAATTTIGLSGLTPNYRIFVPGYSTAIPSDAFYSAGSIAFVTPALGTPASGVATNLSGTAAGLTAGHVTTNANLTGDVTSVGNATTLAAGNAGNLNSGTLLAARMPAHTGDVTSSAGSVALTLAAGNAGNLNSGTLLAARMPALTGDIATSAGAVATTLATVNSNVGTFGSATQSVQFTVNGKGLMTAAANATITPAIGSITGLGTGVGTALALNVGSAGAPVTFNGAGGTPSSLTLTNATGLPTTGLTGVLQAAQEPAHTGDVTNSAGSLALTIGATKVTSAMLNADVFSTAHSWAGQQTFVAPILGTPASGNGANLTGIVSSVAGNTGAFTLTGGLTNSTNAIKRALNEATLSATPADPSTTTSTVGLMMGLGGTCTLTPVYSTRVRVTVYGAYFNASNTNSVNLKLRFGTGTAPINGAASTGTQISNTFFGNVPASSTAIPFSFGGIVAGLTAGTAYWFDFSVAVITSGTVGLQSLTVILEEY